MSDFHYLTAKHDSEKRLWITLRAHDALSPDTALLLKELSAVLHAAAQDISLRAIVITTEQSATASQAETATPLNKNQPKLLQQLAVALELAQLVGQQLRSLDIPSVTLLKHPIRMHDMSLAMATTYCISSNDRRTQLAFPESSHGLHPNILSTQQAISRMGIATAMDYLLTGTALSPPLALKAGLVDACVAPAELHNTALDFLNRKPPVTQTDITQRLRTLTLFRKTLNLDLHDTVRSIGKEDNYPAPYALLRLWEQYGLNNTSTTQQSYLDSIQQLSQTQQAAKLSRVTGLINQLRHTDYTLPDSTIKHIYLIGCGEIACNIATFLLPYGIYVTLYHRQGDKAKQTLAQIRQALPGKQSTVVAQPDNIVVDNMLDSLYHDVQGEMIGDADLVLVIDDLNLADSQELFAELEEKAHANAILAMHPNTLTLDSIAAALLNPQRLVGIHFCNTPAQTGTATVPARLTEISFSQKTDRQLLSNMQLFLRQMGQMTLMTKSSPGQLVNRILVHYVLQGIRLHQQGVPHSHIDRAGQNCGMPEGPLELADRLGLDYCLRLAETLQKAQHNIKVPYSLDDKVRAGQLGIKSGSGFYRYRNGNRLKTERVQWKGSEQALQEKLVGQICEEAAICLEEGLLESPDLIDAGLIFGAGFAPNTGGPLYQQRQHAVK